MYIKYVESYTGLPESSSSVCEHLTLCYAKVWKYCTDLGVSLHGVIKSQVRLCYYMYCVYYLFNFFTRLEI